MKPRKLKTLPVAEVKPRYRSNKKTVMYSGRRWRLKLDKGTWLFIERRGVAQWVPGAATR